MGRNKTKRKKKMKERKIITGRMPVFKEFSRRAKEFCVWACEREGLENNNK